MKRQRSQAPADAFFVGQVAAARGGEVAAVFAAFAEGEVGLAGPPTNSLVASPWQSTQGPRSTLTRAWLNSRAWIGWGSQSRQRHGARIIPVGT
jgi:hypothetical protein